MIPIPVIGGIIEGVGKIADDLYTTEKETRELDLKEKELDQRIDLAQIEVNTESAKNTNWFVSGGRPFVIWVCAAALAYASIVEPVARFVAQVLFGYAGPFPVIDTDITMQMLAGLLGLSGMRSFDKVKGVAR